MQRNTKIIARAGLIQAPRTLRAVCRGRVFLDNIKCLANKALYREFEATLETDGSITFYGHSWKSGFPSYPLAAVRNVLEGRGVLDPVKPTGGWPYWHYLDETTGQWENLNYLWKRALQPISFTG